MSKIDIVSINSQPINNKYATISVFPTGPIGPFYNRRLVRPDYPKALTIENIESKFDNRWDDPSYYYGGGCTDGGDVGEDGDVLGV
jgi:hypothetical protein